MSSYSKNNRTKRIVGHDPCPTCGKPLPAAHYEKCVVEIIRDIAINLRERLPLKLDSPHLFDVILSLPRAEEVKQ